MKLNRHIKWMLGAMVALAGCADDDFINRNEIWDGIVPDELTLTLTIPDPEVVSLGGTRGEDGPINSITLLQYNNGVHISGKNINFDEVPEPNSDGTYTITATLDKNCTGIQIVTNYDVDSSTSDLSAVATSEPRDIADAETAPILWGHAELEDLLSANASLKPEISLMRQTAKLILENNASNFNVKEYGVYNMPTTGTVGPKLSNFDATGKLIAATVIEEGSGKTLYTDNYEGQPENQAIYLFESPASCDGNDKTDATNITRRILIKGEYEGKDYWYVAAFRTRTPETSTVGSDIPDTYAYETIDILRNHIYKLQIQEVRGIGWEKKEDALKSLPDNRATIWLGDITPDITDMIATRDYMLGVSGAVETEWNANAQLKVVTSYPVDNSAELRELLEITVRDDEDKEWMHPEAIDYSDTSMVSSTSSTDPVSGKTIRTLIVNVPLDNNSLTSDDREGWVVVRTGKLTREVKITQMGRPLRSDRETILMGLPGTTVSNYFDWIENSVKGTSDEDNRITIGGMSRNEALIFAAVPAYTLYYRIKKNAGDSTPVISGSSAADFKFSEDGGYWKIEAVKTSEPHISSAVLTITESTADGNVATRYNLLQCGYFHELKAEHMSFMSPVNRPESGWYYYEVVSKNGFYTLDRNIGASSNESYDRSSVNYSEDDERATGAYLMASYERPADRTNQMDNVTICDNLGMTYSGKGRFIIPSRAEMNYLGLLNNGRVNGNSVTVTGLVNGRRIYFPAAGYYYGSQYKNNLHVNLWTRSLLMGTQGLTESDPEYGCSYEGVDILSGVVTFNAFRLANGSDGSLGSVRRFLPVRPIWRGEGETLTTPKLDDAELETEYQGPITIWVKQNAGWSGVNCYAWYMDQDSGKAMQNKAFPGVAMTANQTHNGENNWYKITIDSRYTHLIFAQSTSNKTADIDYYREGHMQATEFEFVIASDKSYEMTALSGSTPPTPAERETVTIMLENVADWADARIRFGYGSNSYFPNKDGKYMEQVMYEGKKYFRTIVNSSDFINLNDDNVDVQFSRQTTANGSWSSFGSQNTQISDVKSRNVIFYRNVTGSGNIQFDDSKTTIDNSKLSIGWSSDNSEPTTKYVLRGSKWSNWNTDEPMTWRNNEWEYTLTTEESVNFKIKQKDADQWFGYDDVDTGHSTSSITNQDGNISLPAGVWSVCFNPDTKKITITGTASGGGGGGEGYDPPAGKVRIVVYKDDDWTGDVKIEYGWQNDSNGQSGRPNVGMNYGGTTTDGIEWYYVDAEPGIYELKVHNGSDYSRKWIKFETKVTSGTIYISIHSNDKTSKKLAPRRKSASRRAITRR